MARPMNANALGGNLVRGLVWGGAACLLLLPWMAMRIDAEGVHWTGGDFAVMGAMLLAVCITYEIAARLARNNAFIVASGLAAGAAFLMTWANLAVGIISSENNPVNQLFFAVVAVAIVGALVARLRPVGLAWAMVATALAQVGVWLYAWLAGHGQVLVFTAVMCVLWLSSAALFRRAARQP